MIGPHRYQATAERVAVRQGYVDHLLAIFCLEEPVAEGATSAQCGSCGLLLGIENRVELMAQRARDVDQVGVSQRVHGVPISILRIVNYRKDMINRR